MNEHDDAALEALHEASRVLCMEAGLVKNTRPGRVGLTPLGLEVLEGLIFLVNEDALVELLLGRASFQQEDDQP